MFWLRYRSHRQHLCQVDVLCRRAGVVTVYACPPPVIGADVAARASRANSPGSGGRSGAGRRPYASPRGGISSGSDHFGSGGDSRPVAASRRGAEVFQLEAVGAVRWTFRSGVREEVIWDWQARNSPPLRSLQPVRETRASWHARHIPVSAFSMSNDDHVWLESGLEHDLLRKCDRDPRVSWLVSQPFRLSWGGPTPGRHTPDLLSLSAEDDVTVWDARRLDEQDETFSFQAEVTRKCCETVGWRYEVFNGLATVERLNLLWLHGFRRRPDWLPRQIGLIRRVAGADGISLGDLFAFDDGSGELKSVVWHLIWLGALSVDLMAPIDDDSFVAVDEELWDV
ncbi:TnsA-like heteromeric transposase endonuclease subunit [Mycolicibacterium vulneris]|uniref:TnsA-like heteromeric transposase endonuclease subunit n=1 Tax=Mycolicibacterium vulneris TaxID=547163 RepID=UPI000DA17D26